MRKRVKQTDTTTIRLSKALKDRLQEMADQQHRTLSNYIRIVLETHAGFLVGPPEEVPPELDRRSARGPAKRALRKRRRASPRRAPHKVRFEYGTPGVARPRKDKKR
jgi:Ribbon-helix-helix protein, copG family